MDFDHLVGVADKASFRVLASPVSVDGTEFQAVIDHDVEFYSDVDALPVRVSTIQVLRSNASLLEPRGARVRVASGREYSTGEVIASDGNTVTRRLI